MISADTLVVDGGPLSVPMGGAYQESSFGVQGVIFGNVTETHTLTGSFIDNNFWEGTYTIEFEGQILLDCSNVLIETNGLRL
jgi:hypothetical protein